MWRGGFWEVGEDGKAMGEQIGAMVCQQDLQGLHITLLEDRQGTRVYEGL